MADLNYNISGRIGDGGAQVFGDKSGTTFREVIGRDTQQKQNEILQTRQAIAQMYQQANIELDGFDKDVDGELQKDKQALREYTRKALKERGYNEQTVAEINALQDQVRQKVAMSKAQKTYANKLKAKLQGNTAPKYFDIEESLNRIKEWKSMPIQDRNNYEKDLLVRKADRYNPYDLPSEAYSPDGVTPERFNEMLTNSPDMQDHYIRGLENSDLWETPEQFYTFVESANDAKYKDRVSGGGSRYPKFNEWGDPFEYDYTTNYQVEGVGEYQVAGKNMVGTNRQVISPKTRKESPGVVTYYTPSSDKAVTEDPGTITMLEYFTGQDGNNYARAYRKIDVMIEPTQEDIDLYKQKQMLTGNRKMLLTDEEIKLELSKTRQKDQFIYIKMDQGFVDKQKKQRPNSFRRFENGLSQTNFETETPSEAYQKWKNDRKKSQATQGNDPDADIMNDLTEF
jgi:hypothetical protein